MSRTTFALPIRVGLLAIALAATAATARADEPPPAAAAPDGAMRAEELIRTGVDLRTAGREREALERFREAYAIHPSPRALAQMGLAAKSLRLYVEAERNLVGALAATHDPWIAESRQALELALGVVSRQLASLVVYSNVEGGELLVDGTPVATLPLAVPVRLPAGPARIEVRATGHSPSVMDATLPAERTTEVTLDVVRREVKITPVSSRTAPLVERRTPPRSSLRPWAFASGGLGVGGVVVGTVFGLMAASELSARDEVCPGGACPTQEGIDHHDDGLAYANVSTIAFAVGGVALGAAVVLWILEPTAPPSARTSRAAASWTF